MVTSLNIVGYIRKNYWFPGKSLFFIDTDLLFQKLLCSSNLQRPDNLKYSSVHINEVLLHKTERNIQLPTLPLITDYKLFKNIVAPFGPVNYDSIDTFGAKNGRLITLQSFFKNRFLDH